jgi:alpha-glucosidase
MDIKTLTFLSSLYGTTWIYMICTAISRTIRTRTQCPRSQTSSRRCTPTICVTFLLLIATSMCRIPTTLAMCTHPMRMASIIRDPTTGDFYYGNNWPGFSVWGDWLVPSTQRWWTNEIVNYHKTLPFDGIWIDLSEAASFCAGSCGNGRLTENPVHPPFLLPGDPLTFDFIYPEGFNVSNATEAAIAAAASSSQAAASSANPPIPAPTTTTMGRTEPTPGVRNLNFPPYVINHVQGGHALGRSAIAPNATHNDQYNTTEYEMHNLFGLQISNATYHSLLELFPGRRPFTVGRSVFAGSGKTTAHWGGDNTSTWGSMFLSISQALTFVSSSRLFND